MSRPMARRMVMNCGLSERDRLRSAFCRAISAPGTLPASCSCWLAVDSTCSISVSAHSSRFFDKSLYSCSSASCWLCVSLWRFSSAPTLICSSFVPSCTLRASTPVSALLTSPFCRRLATSSRRLRICLLVDQLCAASSTASTMTAMLMGFCSCSSKVGARPAGWSAACGAVFTALPGVAFGSESVGISFMVVIVTRRALLRRLILSR